jgi:PAS domain-containing protein
MTQKPIEVILTRQIASYLAMPIFIVDATGTLIFYNEPAESVLGMRFEETGEMPASEWATRWSPSDDQGRPLPPEQIPLMIALNERRPTHGGFRIRGADGALRRIQATAFPLIGQTTPNLGAVVVFWETDA